MRAPCDGMGRPSRASGNRRRLRGRRSSVWGRARARTSRTRYATCAAHEEVERDQWAIRSVPISGQSVGHQRVIRGHQGPSHLDEEVERGHQRSSEVIRGHRTWTKKSRVIQVRPSRVHRVCSRCSRSPLTHSFFWPMSRLYACFVITSYCEKGAVSSNQWQSVAISGNQWQSVVHQWQSVAISGPSGVISGPSGAISDNQ